MVNDEDRFALLVVDSIMGGFRVDYSGRGELADRQQKLARVMNKLQKVSEDLCELSAWLDMSIIR